MAFLANKWVFVGTMVHGLRFSLREPKFNTLWSLNERSWNFETLGTGSKSLFLSKYDANSFPGPQVDF